MLNLIFLSNKHRFFMLALALPWLLLSFSSAGLYAASPLHLAAQPAFGGRFKNGEWLPVFITVENSGPEVNGEIQVTITNQTGQLEFALPAQLASGARKRFTLYILPNNFSRAASVKLIPDGGSEADSLAATEIKLSVIPNDRYVIGGIMANAEGLAAINPPQLEGRREAADFVSLALEDIPDRYEGLRFLNALILNDVDTSQLTPAQRPALSRWVAGGGRLILGGGAGAARTLAGLPTELQPASLSGLQELSSLPGLEGYTGRPIRVPGPFLAAAAQPAAKAAILLDHLGQNNSPGALPLLIELPFGAGYIDWVALDVSQSPFDAWAGAGAFAEKLLAPGAAWLPNLPTDIAPQQASDSQISNALNNLPALDLPSLRFVGLLLVGYIILVGPANYFILRWRDRLAWAWITIPFLTVAFSGLAYGIGFSLRGSDIIVNQISIMELGVDGRASRARTYVGVFSPNRQAYDIEVGVKSLISPLGQYYDPWNGGAATEGRLRLIQGEPARVRGLAVNQWSMQAFVAESEPGDEAGLAVELTPTLQGLEGQVSNQSKATWQDVILTFEGYFQKLGDLAPGQSVPVHLDFQTLGATAGYGSYVLYQEQLNQPNGANREILFKQSVIDSTIFNGNRPDLGDKPVLLAWRTGSGLLPVSIEGREINTQQTTFAYAPISIKFDKTASAIPPGFGQVETLSTSGDASLCNYYPGLAGYSLYQGSAEIKLSLPPDLRHLQPERLDLYLRPDGGWPQLPTVELYDRQSQKWVVLKEAKNGANPIRNIDRYYDVNDAALKIRLSNEGANGGGGCLFLDLAAEGKRL
ncbi:MAG: hypothetical protein U0401_06120 [Anaerolineae bacterium]